MSIYKSQAEREFEQTERLAVVLAAAIIGLWIFLNWDTYFPSASIAAEHTYSQRDTEPESTTMSVAAAAPKPKKNRKTETLPATANDAAPRADLPPADVKAYIQKWAGLAVEEMRRTGIPASISLAQGIVESRAGRSGLALTANNHFGIKCHVSTKCRAGHCINFTDDVELDYFVVYQNAYKSWKAHSEFLKKPRYKKCFQQEDYRGWARELKRAGYATAPKYADIIISIIEQYDLSRYDE